MYDLAKLYFLCCFDYPDKIPILAGKYVCRKDKEILFKRGGMNHEFFYYFKMILRTIVS